MYKKNLLAKLIISFTLVFFHIVLFAQSKSETAKLKIKSKTEYKADFVDGNGKPIIDEKVTFDARGNTISEITYSAEGKLLTEVRYTYNTADQVETEEHYKSNKLTKKFVYKFNDKGLKISKSEYDSANKLVKTKTFSYEFFQ
ncbi:MAG: hypothetical protein IPO21_21000 [Bacteroidales bacterium]|nr:hypothetical protein [Bacteroidales bacterium]